MTRNPIRRWIRRIWITGGLLFMAWLVWNAQPHGVPDGLFESSASLVVTTDRDGMRFEPVEAPADRPGLVFLPGGGIDPDAYVPFVRTIADAGYPVSIVRLPWRLAPTQGQRATVWRRILAVAETWRGRPIVLAGHSRGAALAGRFAHEHPGTLAGLALIGTTHPRDENLSALTVPVVKILGSNDCVAPPDGARANAHNLPATTRWIVIDGANHAQFGHYGSQLNDCSPTITREAQQAQAHDALLELLRLADAPSPRQEGRRDVTLPSSFRSTHGDMETWDQNPLYDSLIGTRRQPPTG